MAGKRIKVTEAKETETKKVKAKKTETKEAENVGRVRWTIANGILTAIQGDVTLGNFDVKKIFPGYEKMTEVQRFIVNYGTKQKLSDGFAGIKDLSERKSILEKAWGLLLDGKTRNPSREGLKARAERLLAEGQITRETFDILFNK